MECGGSAFLDFPEQGAEAEPGEEAEEQGAVGGGTDLKVAGEKTLSGVFRDLQHRSGMGRMGMGKSQMGMGESLWMLGWDWEWDTLRVFPVPAPGCS